MSETTQTLGIDHVGLTVSNLESSLRFFTDCLGWTQFGGNPDYPSVYITDGISKLTLWQAKTDRPHEFDRFQNIGLHHLALKVADEGQLNILFDRVRVWDDIIIEFAPEFSGKGPKIHCMFCEPGGNRIELSFDPR